MINEARSYGARLRHALAALIGVGIILVGVIGMPHAAPAAHADDSPGLTATPTTIAVGGIARVSATGLGGLETAEFGLDSTPGGKFVESSSSTYSAPVTAGTATATFTADQPGTFTIAVGDGETPLATTTVTVSVPAPAPTPTTTPTLTPTPSPSPTPPAGGGQSAWIWALVALAVVLVAGAAITAVVITRRRARSSEQSTPDAAP